MFQYAAGRSLAMRHGVPLLLDITELRSYPKHQGYQFEDVFAGRFEIAGLIPLIRVLGRKARKVPKTVAVVSPKWPPMGDHVWVRQRTHDYDAAFESIGADCYLSGFWQSEKYFATIAPQIRESFRFKEALTGANAAIASRMKEAPSAAIHIRRGDYVTDKGAHAFHGLCAWDYYDAAIDHISRHEPDARFFVFSDDVVAAQERFANRQRAEVVAVNSGRHSYRDMMLMAQCKHQIIANSTFSWWAAWLNQNPDKIVVAPGTWFSGNDGQIKDIYCKDWIVI